MTKTHDIVQKLWNLCNDLRDDGVTYHQYVTELTYLLFLKMAKETGTEGQLPQGFRWDDLRAKSAPERLDHYRQTLLDLGKAGAPLVRQIYTDASSFIRKPTTLSKLVTDIDSLDWYSAKEEGLGALYEGLLAKNANEKKSGAGQYFTPRPLIDAIVTVMKPNSDDTIQDPAAGTGGFLIAAHHFIKAHEEEFEWPESKQRSYYESTFHGMELVPDTQRLALMNLMLHGLANDPERSGIRLGDTLSENYKELGKATLILSNPPFGTKKGG
ncbi:MAG: N-6 DNA methylase, partial [Deinococcus sp.]